MYYESDPGIALVALIFTLLIYIGIPVLFGLGGWNMAKSRGRHQWGWAIASAITGIVGLIALAIVGETQEVKQKRANVAAERAAMVVNAAH